MLNKERAQWISSLLDDLFPHPKISLHYQDPYTLLIAVLLSAQCTDKRVNQVTPLLFRRADTPRKMCALTIDDIRHIIRPCGLSQRKAKAIWELSHILVDKHHGRVPRTLKALEALPGVGHKTASVVLTTAFHRPTFPVDTHIHRCAKRWGLSSGKSTQQTERDLKRLFPKKNWHRLHIQIILYARAYCPARGHHVEKCPICMNRPLA